MILRTIIHLLFAAVLIPFTARATVADAAAAANHSSQTLAHADVTTAQLGLKFPRTGNTMQKMRRIARSLGLKKTKSYESGGQTHEDWTGIAKLATGRTASARFQLASCSNSKSAYYFALYLKNVRPADISAVRARMNTRNDLRSKKGPRHTISYANPDRFRDGFVKKAGTFSFGFVVIDPPNSVVGQLQFSQHHYCKR